MVIRHYGRTPVKVICAILIVRKRRNDEVATRDQTDRLKRLEKTVIEDLEDRDAPARARYYEPRCWTEIEQVTQHLYV